MSNTCAARICMKHEGNNIYSVFDELMPRHKKEHFLQQRGTVVWLTGLSGAGKSTIAIQLERQLFERNFFAQVLDGDNMRAGLNKALAFDEAGRTENIRRLAEVAKLFANSGAICVVCSISPSNATRALARQILRDEQLLEVHISTPLKACETRDPKGLYAKARAGEVTDFTGVSAPYEAPAAPHLELTTTGKSIAETTDTLFQFLLPYIQLFP